MKRLQFLAWSVPLVAGLAAVFLPAEAASLPAGPAPGTLGAPTALPATAPPAPHSGMAPRKKGPTIPARQVDLNSATAAELMTVPGIGATEAAKIIAHRPYLSKTDLVTKNVLPTGPYLSLKRHVVALQGKGTQGKARAAAHPPTTGSPR